MPDDEKRKRSDKHTEPFERISQLDDAGRAVDAAGRADH